MVILPRHQAAHCQRSDAEMHSMGCWGRAGEVRLDVTKEII